MNRERELSLPEDDYENSPAKWQVKEGGQLPEHAVSYPMGAVCSQPCSKEELLGFGVTLLPPHQHFPYL